MPSTVTPMNHKNAPKEALPPTLALSVRERLGAHQAQTSWEPVSAKDVVAMCHKAGCVTCDTYLGHLAKAAWAGQIKVQPADIEKALDQAWPSIMQGIREDARKEVHRELKAAHCELEMKKNKLDRLGKDYKILLHSFSKEVQLRWDFEDKLAQKEKEATEKVSSSFSKRKEMVHTPPQKRKAIESLSKGLVAPAATSPTCKKHCSRGL